MLLDVAKQFLEKSGDFDVRSTTSTQEAYRAAILGEIDIVVSDYQMPEENGLELLKRIRDAGNQIPFIIFTGKGREEVAIEAFNNGADFYIQKGGEVRSQFVELAHKMRVAVERAMQRKEIHQYSDIVQRMESGLFILELMDKGNPTSLILRNINLKAKDFMHGREDLIGKGIVDAMSRLVPTGMMQRFADVVIHEQPYHAESFFYPDNNGNPRYFNLDAFPLPNQQLGVLIQDVSSRMIMENQLNESERRLRELMDKARSIIIHWSSDGTITYVNEFAEKVFGYTRDELTGKSLVGTIVPMMDVSGRDLSKMMEQIATDTQKWMTNENENLTKDGHRIWVRWSNSAVKNEKDGSIEIISVGSDITESREAHHRLLESERRLNDIFEFLPDATLSIDMQGKVIAWNKAMENMTGIKKGEMLGKGDNEYTIPFYGERRKQLMDLIDIDDAELIEKYKFVRREGNILYAEAFTPALNGGRGAYVWATASPLFDQTGSRIGAIESIRDISDRITYENALRAEKERYRLINDSSEDIIYSYDCSSRFTSANRRLCQSMGLTPEEIIGRTHAELGFPPEACEEWDRLHARVFATDRTVQEETSTSMPDGKLHFFEVVLNPLHDENGKIIGIGGTTRDITEQKMNRNLLETQYQLEKLLGEAKNLDEVLETSLRAAISVSDMDCGGIYLVDPDTGDLKLAYVMGLSKDFVSKAMVYSHESKNSKIIERGEPIYAKYPEVESENIKIGRYEGLKALAIIPAKYQNRTECVLNLSSHKVEEVPTHSRNALESIAIQIGQAVSRERMRESFERERSNFHMFFDSSEDMLFVADMEGKIVSINSKVTALLGYQETDLLGEAIQKVHHPKDMEEAVRVINLMLNGEMDSCHLPVMRRDGILIPVETKVVKGIWNGHPAIFGSSRDMSSMKRIQDELGLTNDKLRLLSSITIHDINNQLTILRGYADLASREEDSSKRKNELVRMVKAADAISRHIEFAGDYEKVGMGKPVWLPLEGTIKKAYSHLEMGGIKVKIIGEDYLVLADPMLEKVFYNLVENTIRHGVKAKNATFTITNGKKHLLISYEDDGVGLSKEVVSKGFGKDFGNNSGHGLFLSSAILEMTGISIVPSSRDIGGARFDINVPEGNFRPA